MGVILFRQGQADLILADTVPPAAFNASFHDTDGYWNKNEQDTGNGPPISLSGVTPDSEMNAVVSYVITDSSGSQVSGTSVPFTSPVTTQSVQGLAEGQLQLTAVTLTDQAGNPTTATSANSTIEKGVCVAHLHPFLSSSP